MKKYFIGSLFIMIAVACNKSLPDAPSSFAVTASSNTIDTGQTITFNISGVNPDQIVLFSGEPGSNYDFVNRLNAAGIPKLVFQTAMQLGATPPNPSLDSLKLLISTNLSGYDSTSIMAANWTDITTRNTKWPTTLGSTFTTSDSIDLSDFNAFDSVNIAFRVVNKQNPTLMQRYWQMQGFGLYNILPEGTSCALFSAPSSSNAAGITDFKYVGWVEASLLNNNDSGFNAWNVGSWNVSSATSNKNSNGITIRSGYPITFNPVRKVNTPDNDDWLITSKVNLKQVKPDLGTVIKGPNDLPLSSFQKTFHKSGTYNVVFIAMNTNYNGNSQVVRKIQIIVN